MRIENGTDLAYVTQYWVKSYLLFISKSVQELITELWYNLTSMCVSAHNFQVTNINEEIRESWNLIDGQRLFIAAHIEQKRKVPILAFLKCGGMEQKQKTWPQYPPVLSPASYPKIWQKSNISKSFPLPTSLKLKHLVAQFQTEIRGR